ncbi:hypothetical protein LDENG_00053720 [Lucifuga dentata]|nr:hypothetical protein LDENG_00053720 [Lucifuga dentata]
MNGNQTVRKTTTSSSPKLNKNQMNTKIQVCWCERVIMSVCEDKQLADENTHCCPTDANTIKTPDRYLSLGLQRC